jgi:protein-serine/threonine kinase
VSPHSGYRRPFETLEQVDASSAPNFASLAYGSSNDMFSISSHEITLDAPSSERTNAFFTSQSTDYKLPTPPRRSATLSSRTSRDSQLSDKSANLVRSRSERRTSPPRSATESFFYKGPRTPSPPPSLHSSASNGPTTSMPPLSRFFPSRYRRARDALDDNASIPSSSSKASPEAFASSPPLSPPPDQTLAHFPVDLQATCAHVHLEQAPPANASHQPEDGECYESDDIKLTYLRCIGKGAFSSVWLARDDSGGFSHDQQPHERRPSESVARRPRDRKMDGLKPTHPGATLSFSTPRLSALPLVSHDQIRDDRSQGPDSALANDGAPNLDDVSKPGRLVAVKMMNIAVCDANDRTRISFVREVEVLRVRLPSFSRRQHAVLHADLHMHLNTAYFASEYRFLSALFHNTRTPLSRFGIHRGKRALRACEFIREFFAYDRRTDSEDVG